jgi:hypothetical protein
LARRLIIRSTSLVSIRLLVSRPLLRMLRNSQPFLSPPPVAVSIQASDYDDKEPRGVSRLSHAAGATNAFVVLEVVADPQSIGGTEAGEAEDHQSNQCTISRTDEPAGVNDRSSWNRHRRRSGGPKYPGNHAYWGRSLSNIFI